MAGRLPRGRGRGVPASPQRPARHGQRRGGCDKLLSATLRYDNASAAQLARSVHFRARRPGRRQLLQRRWRHLWWNASLVLTVNRAPHTGQLLDHRSSVRPLVRTLRPMNWYTWSPTIRSLGSMVLAISRTDPAWSSGSGYRWQRRSSAPDGDDPLNGRSFRSLHGRALVAVRVDDDAGHGGRPDQGAWRYPLGAWSSSVRVGLLPPLTHVKRGAVLGHHQLSGAMGRRRAASMG